MKKITYLFDPLCGWCYGASPAIRHLMTLESLNVELAPTGLFVGGGRVISPAFAEYAWSNDMRIAQMTGQQFTQAYKQQVLGNIGASFDSTFATLALTALKLTAPDQELEVLHALQAARYVKGLETSDSDVVISVLREMDLPAEANRLATLDDELQAANSERLQAAQQLMHVHRLQGVPALVVHGNNGNRLISNDLLFGESKRLVASVMAL